MKKFSVILFFLLSIILTGCRGTYDKYNETGFIVGEGEVPCAIKNIEIFWHTGDVEIKYGDLTNIKIEEESKYVINSSEEVRYKYENNNLTIRFAASNIMLPAAIFDKNLTITLPKDYKIDLITINNITGDITTSILAQNIDVSAVNSNINITNEYIDCSYNIEVVTGDIIINRGIINKITCDIVTGNLEITTPKIEGGAFLNVVTGNIILNAETFLGGGNIEVVTGNLEIYTSNFTDTVLSYEITTGRWITATQNIESNSGRIRLGNCTYTLNLKTTTGDIKFIDNIFESLCITQKNNINRNFNHYFIYSRTAFVLFTKYPINSFFN